MWCVFSSFPVTGHLRAYFCIKYSSKKKKKVIISACQSVTRAGTPDGSTKALYIYFELDWDVRYGLSRNGTVCLY